MLWINIREELIIGSVARGLCLITRFLQAGEYIQIDIEIIRLWPYLLTIGGGVFAIVVTIGGQFQRNQILVEVVLIIATQTDKHSQLSIL